MIRTFRLHTEDIDESDPFSGILAAVAFATRATAHTTLQATPSQLVFGRDAILQSNFQADWAVITARKQKLINKNNARENAKRKFHQYKVNDRSTSHFSVANRNCPKVMNLPRLHKKNVLLDVLQANLFT